MADPGTDIWLRICQYWLYGLLGGLIQDQLAGGAITLPAWDPKCRRLKLGVFGSMLMGLGAAVLVDGSIVTALSAAIAGPYVLENVVEKTAARFKKPPTNDTPNA